jgi:hypothetical protein
MENAENAFAGRINFDKDVIEYFRAHRQLPNDVFRMEQRHLRELLDSIPLQNKELRREIANAGGFR